MTGGVGNEVKFAMGNVRWKDASHDSQNLAWTKKTTKNNLKEGSQKRVLRRGITAKVKRTYETKNHE